MKGKMCFFTEYIRWSSELPNMDHILSSISSLSLSFIANKLVIHFFPLLCTIYNNIVAMECVIQAPLAIVPKLPDDYPSTKQSPSHFTSTSDTGEQLSATVYHRADRLGMCICGYLRSLIGRQQFTCGNTHAYTVYPPLIDHHATLESTRLRVLKCIGFRGRFSLMERAGLGFNTVTAVKTFFVDSSTNLRNLDPSQEGRADQQRKTK